MSPGRRFAVIAGAVAAMAAGVWLVGELAFAPTAAERVETDHRPPETAIELLAEQAGQFAGVGDPRRVLAVPADEATGRRLATVYARRAYPGAPPAIPHKVQPEMGAAPDDCLSCHRDGGWAPPFEAYAPRTPHPQLVGCRQCHVAPLTDDLFRDTTFVAAPPPKIHRPALPGAPPPLPHGLQMRENCLSCHAGPAATFEVRTSHPERPGCLQCHVPQAEVAAFRRPAPRGGSAG